MVFHLETMNVQTFTYFNKIMENLQKQCVTLKSLDEAPSGSPWSRCCVHYHHKGSHDGTSWESIDNFDLRGDTLAVPVAMTMDVVALWYTLI